MAGPLDVGMGSPPAPNPDAGRSQASAMPGHNALMMPQQQRMPAPSHQETVAALRHFMAIISELRILDKNPSLGRANCKDPIIDGVSKLVAERMMPAANAVPLLADVPDDPLQQRKWVKQKLQQMVAAQNNVLSHHVATHPPTLDWAQESLHQPNSVDDHMQAIGSLHSQYMGGR